MEVEGMFTYVKLRNFRSFKEATFDFRNGRKGTKRFISIYGENGSGKSNFVTSIDFLRRTIESFPMAIQTEKITELEREKEFSQEILDILLNGINIQKYKDNCRMIECDDQQLWNMDSE